MFCLFNAIAKSNIGPGALSSEVIVFYGMRTKIRTEIKINSLMVNEMIIRNYFKIKTELEIKLS